MIEKFNIYNHLTISFVYTEFANVFVIIRSLCDPLSDWSIDWLTADRVIDWLIL